MESQPVQDKLNRRDKKHDRDMQEKLVRWDKNHDRELWIGEIEKKISKKSKLDIKVIFVFIFHNKLNDYT
jgi:hypothetical protein